MKNWRINFILVIILLFGAAIISRLFYLQILNYKFYRAQALGQQTIFQEVEGARGEIFFKGKTKSLAINNDKWLVYAMPQEIEDKNEAAKSLSGIIKEPSNQIFSKIEKQDSYTVIKSKLTDQEVEKIKNLKIKGIYLDRLVGRYYPQEGLASQLVGFVGGDGTGQYGLEGYYEETLKGKKSYEAGSQGIFSFGERNTNSDNLDGSDLYLTIDYNIQFKAESLLKKAKNDFNIDSGQIIAMEPDTGKIVAMANFPSFDPNQYAKEKDVAIFQNSAVQKIFEMGSVLKPVTMAIALNESRITPETSYVDQGFVKIGVETIYNYDRKKYGQQTMTGVLEKSINTGAVFVSKLIPPDTYLDYIDRFGFGDKTGIDLQGEIYSRNDNLRNGKEINFATASFGQGIEITPIQLIRAFCAIANGGNLVKPYVVEKIVSGSQEAETKPKIIKGIINPETSTQLKTMLISVVENGSAKKAQIPGYYVAGKTGTAQVAYEDKPGYYPDRTIHSFLGFAPVLNPKFVIMVKLDNPKTNLSSSATAASIFAELAQYTLNYWQIPPDYE